MLTGLHIAGDVKFGGTGRYGKTGAWWTPDVRYVKYDAVRTGSLTDTDGTTRATEFVVPLWYERFPIAATVTDTNGTAWCIDEFSMAPETETVRDVGYLVDSAGGNTTIRETVVRVAGYMNDTFPVDMHGCIRPKGYQLAPTWLAVLAGIIFLLTSLGLLGSGVGALWFRKKEKKLLQETNAAIDLAEAEARKNGTEAELNQAAYAMITEMTQATEMTQPAPRSRKLATKTRTRK